jgi:hypothetical protein
MMMILRSETYCTVLARSLSWSFAPSRSASVVTSLAFLRLSIALPPKDYGLVIKTGDLHFSSSRQTRSAMGPVPHPFLALLASRVHLAMMAVVARADNLYEGA